MEDVAHGIPQTAGQGAHYTLDDVRALSVSLPKFCLEIPRDQVVVKQQLNQQERFKETLN